MSIKALEDSINGAKIRTEKLFVIAHLLHPIEWRVVNHQFPGYYFPVVLSSQDLDRCNIVHKLRETLDLGHDAIGVTGRCRKSPRDLKSRRRHDDYRSFSNLIRARVVSGPGVGS